MFGGCPDTFGHSVILMSLNTLSELDVTHKSHKVQIVDEKDFYPINYNFNITRNDFVNFYLIKTMI